MSARRLKSIVVGLLCGLACVLAVGPGSAVAASRFGSGGTEAGQLKKSLGLGLDQETGDVYAPDFYSERVSKFDGRGDFLFAWGWGVVNGANESQTCTVTTGCQIGNAGYGAGEFASSCGAEAVAVDNDPLSASYKDLYVVDFCNERVQKFDSSGKFLLMFGGHVNGMTGGNVCVAGEVCTQGTQGTANGEFEWAYGHSYIAMGPDGAVYVGDKARIQVFESSGDWRENISLAGLSGTGKVTALAVDSAGDMFVADEEVAGVHELEPSGSEKATIDTGSTSVEAITVDAEDNLFVADSSGGFHVIRYDSAGKEIASFGSKTVESTKGIVFSDTSDDLYVSGESSIWTLTSPPPGPLLEPGSESATPGLHGTAVLEAVLNPEGNETTYHFEYVDQAHYQVSGYTSALSTTPALVGSSFDDQPVSADLTKLAPGIYHYRIVATNSRGTTTGSDQLLTTALVEGPWTTNVASTSVTFSARIDPLGPNTEYKLEYGASASYGHSISGSLGESSSYTLISYHQQELQPGANYHYRIILTNEFGTFEGADHTFTTQVAGNELTLPDGRAWELVSPPNKKGALIETLAIGGEIQASSDGAGITYLTQGPDVGENPVGKENVSQVLSTHGPQGWTSEDITPPHSLPEGGGAGGEEIYFAGFEEYRLFSTDLSSAVVEPFEAGMPPLSPEATERTLYVRNNATRGYLPLVTPTNVPPGTKFGGSIGNEGASTIHFLAATPDLSHVVFETPAALTPEAVTQPIQPSEGELRNLYEWSNGQLQLVNVLPDGEATTQKEVFLAGKGAKQDQGSVAHAMSVDGRRVMWTIGAPYGGDSKYEGLYLRDTLDKRTVRVGGRGAVLQTMNSDGSKIFYRENGDLYVFDADAGLQTDITAKHGVDENNAGVKETVLGASDNGSYVYYVATGALTAGAVSGEDNLYVSQDTGNEWVTRLIGVLSSEDEKSWYAQNGFNGAPDLALVSSRVSPDGRYLTFMSNRSLTGYDNVDAVSGLPDEEVYLYDASTARLVCASCNPTGARPVGVFDEHPSELLVDRHKSWTSTYSTNNHWLAGSVPGWDEIGDGASYQPRYLSDDGRLFFDSPEALVPQDTNGLEDVYEYEPPGVGSCGSADATFSERLDGCVNLISSGTSSAESAFFDASENGEDVFFVTSSRLTASDYDTNYDLYDARVCSAASPCAAAPVTSPPCTSGDSCKAAPSPQPEIFGPAPSATFSGTGNVTALPAARTVKPKSLTRAQKLARALKACRNEKSAKKRAACDRQARKSNATRRTGKAKTTRKGDR